MGLTFLPQPPPSRSKKRSRAVADIDGEHSCMQKKKRRLRLFLITSRLSPQFSHPATNIVDRGSSKIAVWAKQKALGRNLLRKAAILNRIRRRAISAKEVQAGHGQVLVEQEREQEQLEMARLEFDHGSVDTYTRPVLLKSPSVPPAAAIRRGDHFVVSGSPSTSPTTSRSPSPTPPSPPLGGRPEEEAPAYRSPNEAYASYSPPRAQIPRRDYLPLPPSPLGMSPYDVFDTDYSRFDDDDDEPLPNPFDDDEDDDDVPFSPSAITTPSATAPTDTIQVQKTPPATVYSDFNVLDPSEPVFGAYDQVDDGVDTIWPSTFAHEATSSTPGSTSPDFAALFATALPSPNSKRTDSFATSPNFRPHVPSKSISPNFAPSAVAATVSSSTSTSSSLNFTPSTTATTSPNFAPERVYAPVSPNFAAIDGPAYSPRPNKQEGMTGSSHEVAAKKQYDIEQERKRRRDARFMRFDA